MSLIVHVAFLLSLLRRKGSQTAGLLLGATDGNIWSAAWGYGQEGPSHSINSNFKPQYLNKYFIKKKNRQYKSGGQLLDLQIVNIDFDKMKHL